MRSKTQTNSGLRWIIALAICTAVALPSIALAAQGQAEQNPPAAQQQTANPSEDKLEAVARAYVKVQAVQQEYGQKIQAAQQTEKAQLEDEANQKMVKAVNDSGGVTVSEYTQILQAAQQDKQLRARLVQHIEKQP